MPRQVSRADKGRDQQHLLGKPTTAILRDPKTYRRRDEKAIQQNGLNTVLLTFTFRRHTSTNCVAKSAGYGFNTIMRTVSFYIT
jgi:hypothetical protein